MSSQMSDKSQKKIASFLFNKPYGQLTDQQKQTVNSTYQKSTSIVKSLLSNAPTNSSTDAIVSQALSANTVKSIEKSGSRISGELKSKIIESVVRFFPQNRFTSVRFNLSGSPYTASSYAEKYAQENEIDLGQQPSVGRPPAIPTITEQGDGATLTMPTALSGQAIPPLPSIPRAGMGAGETGMPQTPAIQSSGTVVIVEDQTPNWKMMKRSADKFSSNVVVVENLSDARKYFNDAKQRNEVISSVFLDNSFPDTKGGEIKSNGSILFNEILNLFPRVNVYVSSTDSDVQEQFRSSVGRNFQKVKAFMNPTSNKNTFLRETLQSTMEADSTSSGSENTVDETDVRLMEGGGATEEDDAGAEGRGVAYADYTAEETKGEEGMILALQDEGDMKSSQQPSHTRIIDESQRPEMPQQIPTQPTSQEEIDEIAREQVVETLQGLAGEGAGDAQDTGEMVSEQEAVPDPEDSMGAGAGGQPMDSSVPSGLVVSGAGDGGDEFDGVPERPSRQSPADLITQSGLLGKPKYYQQLIAQGGQLAGGATPFKGIKADDLSPLSNKEVFELIRITVKLYGKRIGVRRQFTSRTSKRADLEQEYHELSMLVHMYYSVKMGMSSAPRMGMILPQSMMGGMAPLVQQLSELVQSRSADAGQGQQQGQGQHSIHAQHAQLRNSMLQNRAGATGRPTAQLQNTAQLPTQLSQFAPSVRQSSAGLSGSGMQFTPFYGTRDRVMSSARQVEGRGEPIRIPFR